MDVNTWATVAALIGVAVTVIAMLRKSLAEVSDDLGERIDKVDGRVSDLDTKLTTKIDALDAKLTTKIDALDTKIDTKTDTLSAQLYELNTRVTAALGLPRAADG